MLQNKRKILSVILVLTMLVAAIAAITVTASAADGDVTITTKGTTGVKSADSSSISWSSGSYSVVNYKNTSSTAIRTSDSDHFRCYVGNKLTISGGKMSKVVINTVSSYLISDSTNKVSAGWTVSANGTVVTYTATSGSASELTITIGKQSRIKSVVITPAATGDDDCTHANAEDVKAVAATCTTGGYTAGVYCPDCETYVSGHEEVKALGHSGGAATCEVRAVCDDCGTEYGDLAPHNYVNRVCSVCEEEMPNEATVSFATLDQRTEYSTSKQVWQNDGLVITNNKSSSTTNIGNYSNPVRFYKSSQVIIAFPGMTSIVIEASGGDSDWAATLTHAGLTFEKTSTGYSITFDKPTDSIALTCQAQVRAYSITVSAPKAAACDHAYDNACDKVCNLCGEETRPEAEHNYNEEVTAPDCLNGGFTTYTCACGDSYTGNATDALGHSYDSVVTEPSCSAGYTTYTCTVCGYSYVGDEISAKGHSYENGICTECGEPEPDFSGRYFIATKRTEGGYWYMTSDLGIASTKRYQAFDAGLDVLPENVSAIDGFVFVVEKNSDGSYRIYAEGVEGNNYLGYTSGNSGTLVSAEKALSLTIILNNLSGTYNISFANEEQTRYLALNNSTKYNYFAWYEAGQKENLSLIPVSENACRHENVTVITKDATCTESGWIKTICECGFAVSTEEIYATGHSYVDGICHCGTPESDFSGEYYISAFRGDAYWYMTCDLGTANTKRYQAVQMSNTLPVYITNPDNQCVFVLERNDDGTYCIYAKDISGNDKYLGWESGNSGILVSKENALSFKVEYSNGAYIISFVDNSRSLALNAQSGNDYFAFYGSTGSQIKNLSLIPVGKKEASIGGVYYNTLQEAFDAAVDGSTIKLVDDVALSVYLDVFTQHNGFIKREITLDLNEKTISSAADYIVRNEFPLVYVGLNQTLNITGNGQITTHVGVTIGSYGTVNLIDVTVKNTSGELNEDSNALRLYVWDNEPGYIGYVEGVGEIGDSVTIIGGVYNEGELAVNGGSIDTLENTNKLDLNGGVITTIDNKGELLAGGQELFSFLGAGIRYADAEGVIAPIDKVSMRFGYRLADAVTAWGWDYQIGDYDPSELVGSYITKKGVSNIVFNNIPPAFFNVEIKVRLWVEVETDDYTYKFVDEWQSRTALYVLQMTATHEVGDVADYARSAVELYQQSYAPVAVLNDNKNKLA